MAKLIQTAAWMDAWVEAAEFLLTNGPMLNLVLEIGEPGRRGYPKAAEPRLDDFFVGEGQLPIHTVAETIFPASEYRRRGLKGVYETYPDETFREIKRHPKISWGAYAHRLVRRKTADGQDMNPLKQMIGKMNSALATKGTMRSCYDINVAEGEYDIPLYNTVKDGKRRRGGPCLSHLSFKLFVGAVHLTAFYRSHDYRYKVPGNLLGLARLQHCVATETRQDMGTLVVHSSYATLGGPKGRMQKLLDDLRSLKEAHEEADVLAHRIQQGCRANGSAHLQTEPYPPLGGRSFR